MYQSATHKKATDLAIATADVGIWNFGCSHADDRNVRAKNTLCIVQTSSSHNLPLNYVLWTSVLNRGYLTRTIVLKHALLRFVCGSD
jgi:hypothetical protein